MFTPAKSNKPLQLCALAGATEVVRDGDWVRGNWPTPLKEVKGQTNLIGEFLNWSDSLEEIVRFVRKYGPPLQDSAKAGEKFAIHRDNWQFTQQFFRNLWRDALKYSNWEVPNQENMGSFAVRKHSLTYTTANLYLYLYLQLAMLPAERLKICLNPECLSPYFVAHHLRQNYCDERCAEWGQRKAKQEWWHQHGDEWRSQRRAGKERNNGPRKAR